MVIAEVKLRISTAPKVQVANFASKVGTMRRGLQQGMTTLASKTEATRRGSHAKLKTSARETRRGSRATYATLASKAGLDRRDPHLTTTIASQNKGLPLVSVLTLASVGLMTLAYVKKIPTVASPQAARVAPLMSPASAEQEPTLALPP